MNEFVAFAPGVHLLADFYGACQLDDTNLLEATLRTAAKAANASVLSSHFHQFGGGGGVTGVVILAESHISIHTWPERGFAAVDVFMCGNADPERAIQVLTQTLTPKRVETKRIERGYSNHLVQPSR